MFVLELIGGILLIAAVILAPMFGLYAIVKLFWERFIEPPPPLLTGYTQTYNDQVHVKIEHANTEQILLSKFRFYQNLGDGNKSKFLKRISTFIRDKHFRAMEMELTEEMVVLISASAIQLTFGLEGYLLDHFDKIFIYPGEFYSRMSKEYHKGETNLGGVIVLSWRDFTEGYANRNDNLNLGLHEMAHALRFDKLQSDDYDKFFADYIDKWQLIAQEEFQKIKNHQPSFLRAYGGTNFGEFFSVCVEYFFESPDEFKKTLPEIYKHLCILLNQDPSMNVTNFRQKNLTVENTNFEFGELALTFKNDGESIFSTLFIFVPVGLIGYFVINKNAIHPDYFILEFIAPFMILSILGNILDSKKRICFYANGMRFESGLSTKFDMIIAYENVISLTFRRAQGRGQTDSIIVHLLVDGQTKKKNYDFTSDEIDMKNIAAYLAKKNIPVKGDGYTITN